MLLSESDEVLAKDNVVASNIYCMWRESRVG
jgi:hypothetical protein